MYVAHIIFLLDGKDFHGVNGSDLQSPISTSCLFCIPTDCKSWDYAYHTQTLEEDKL